MKRLFTTIGLMASNLSKSMGNRDFSPKIFLSVNEKQKNEILKQLDSRVREKLFLKLREHYSSDKNPESKRYYEDAILICSIYEIKKLPITEQSYIKGMVVNILKFMNKNIKYCKDVVPEAENRDACEWTAKKSLIVRQF